MGRDPDDGSLERLLDERGQQFMRAAIALTGSRADGEDLLQAALERLVQNWRRIETDPEGYLRRTLYNLAADGWRRRGRWRRRLAEFRAQAQAGQACPEASSEDVAAVDLRDALVRLLHQLPPRQRAVVVLRYWEQRTEAETAALLGCSEGTVKSTASRGLQRLRELAGPLGFRDGSLGLRDGSPGLGDGSPGFGDEPGGSRDGGTHAVTAGLRPGMTLAGGRP